MLFLHATLYIGNLGKEVKLLANKAGLSGYLAVKIKSFFLGMP
jgi:hypothetical protein